MRRLKKKLAAAVIAELAGEPIYEFPKKWPKKSKKKARRRPASTAPSFMRGPYTPHLPRKDSRRQHNDRRNPAHNSLKEPSLGRSVFGPHITPVQICVRCRTASKSAYCTSCKRPRQGAGKKARAPRKQASDRMWKAFCQQFGLRYEDTR